MTSQLIITMRSELARRFAQDRSVLDVSSLLEAFGSARLIGAPGFSMRVSVDDREAKALESALDDSFVVESDYAMSSFQQSKSISRAGGTRRR